MARQHSNAARQRTVPKLRQENFPALHTPRKDQAGFRAANGRIRMLGGNLGFDYPVFVDAVDDQGVMFSMPLAEVLGRLAEFEQGNRKASTAQDIVACCFIAYESGLMTEQERLIFESFVKREIGEIGSIEAAKQLVLGRTQSRTSNESLEVAQ